MYTVYIYIYIYIWKDNIPGEVCCEVLHKRYINIVYVGDQRKQFIHIVLHIYRYNSLNLIYKQNYVQFKILKSALKPCAWIKKRVSLVIF